MLISVLALALIFSLDSLAQGGPGGGPGRGFNMTEDDVKERVANTAETLGLSEDQHKKVEKIELDFYNRMQVERQKRMNAGGQPSPGEREAMREEMSRMRDERDAKYKEILNDEQYTKWKELQEQRRSEMQQQRRNNPDGEGEGGDRPARGRGRG